MKKLIQRFPIVVVCAVSLLFMALFAACAGVAVPTTNSPVTVTGTIKSVNTANGSITPAVQNSDGSYTISTGSNSITIAVGTPEGIQTPGANETPGGTESAGNPQAGTISFIGKVQSVNGNSIVVSLPNGSTLTVNIVNGTTDLGDFNNTAPAAGATIKVAANANTDGSYTATKLSQTDSGDLSNPTKLNTVDFQGMTTSAVGADRVIHFTVGKKSYSYTIGSTADLGDFNSNAQGIQANRPVKVEVLFSGSNGSVTKVSLNNGQ